MGGYFSYLLDGANWTFESNGFFTRILEHLGYTAVAVLVAAVIAFPIGLLIGHTNKGAFFAINLGNAARAVPTIGILFLVLALAGLGLVPVIAALVALAIPPILTTTYAGIRSVDPAVVDAARGIGLREKQIVTQVELPVALPIIMGGLRNAVLQVVATATIAAYVGQGGLGRYLFSGLALRDYPRVVAGSVLVAVLAVLLDLAISGIQRLLVSPGTDGRAAKRRTKSSSRRAAERGHDVTQAVGTALDTSRSNARTP